jgi:CheY-like chemotaxis protein
MAPVQENPLNLDDGAGPQRRILVYEDDETIARAFADTLRRAGYEVVIASHFEQALKAIEGSHPPDLLVADIVTPGGVNGLAMARMAIMKRPSIKIIHVTGYDLPELAAMGLGAVLRKPVSEERLLAEVGRLLED